MRKKLFGEFLLEKDLISTEQLVASLLDQIRNTPSIAEIVFKEKILPASTILKALSLETRTNKSFVAACQELGVWSNDIETKVMQEIRNARPPVGQILKNQGIIDDDDIKQALVGFFEDRKQMIIRRLMPIKD